MTGIPNQTYGVDAQGGRVYSVSASSGQNPVTATGYNYAPSGYSFTLATPVSSISYGSNDSDTFSYDNMLRMAGATYKVGAQQVAYGFTWNANGTLSSFTLNDPWNTNNVGCNIDTPGAARFRL